MWLPRRFQRKPAPNEAVIEALQVLEGRAYEAYAFSQRVPAWVLVNALGHSRPAALRGMASGKRLPHLGRWSGTLGHLATELLARAGDEPALEAIQRDLLVPLELELLASGCAQASSPARLASVVEGALAHARRDAGS